MALYIRDAEVDALAEQVKQATKAKTKTEAVREALLARLAQTREGLSLSERLARSRATIAKAGQPATDIDMKAYMDELWGGN
ncbi:MAG: type II toxin-antitoxin system VapB family antitoxin [Rhizobiaceae bacterium]|nr:type II toxin-antitoxin system VapB family antitoxin [Rhizobiaceae bacterium]MCV0406524.1 type II toxin-antitoxin system VapB family antitoxin [Rhizobiaceae bacterium]